MESFDISEYLQNYVKATSRGSCKSCGKDVKWAKETLASHKRANCAAASEDEKRKFAKRRHGEISSTASGNISFDGDQFNDKENAPQSFNSEQKKIIDEKLANFFFRTGISFRLADSDAFKDLVNSLNSQYSDAMPSSRTLSGPLLDAKYTKCFKLMNDMMENSEHLTLVSDGWTNVRGDHIVNFCIKAPGCKPFFHSSINTSGIAQNALAVADAISSVIERDRPS